MLNLMKVLLLSALLGTAILAGCASTKSSQMSPQDQALFNAYSPQERYLIRSGKIDIGFDQDQVRMAWGEPDNVRSSTNASGTALVWEYHELEPNYRAISGAGATINRGFDAGVGVVGNPVKPTLRKHVYFDRSTHEVSKFETF